MIYGFSNYITAFNFRLLPVKENFLCRPIFKVGSVKYVLVILLTIRYSRTILSFLLCCV